MLAIAPVLIPEPGASICMRELNPGRGRGAPMERGFVPHSLVLCCESQRRRVHDSLCGRPPCCTC